MLKFSKKFLSLIMAVLMLTMTAIGVNAEELITGIDDLLIDIGIIDPSPEEELMPMAASGCHTDYYIVNNLYNNEMEPTDRQGALAALSEGGTVWVTDDEVAYNLVEAMQNEYGINYYYDHDAPHQNGNYQYEHYQDGNGSHICFGTL